MEFFGPWGTGTLIVLLPVTVLSLTTLVGHDLPHSLTDLYTQFMADASSFGIHHLSVYLVWLMSHFLLYVLVPGKTAEGTLLRDSTKLKYKTNALTILTLLTAATMYACVYSPDILVWLSNNIMPLAIASSLVSLVLSVFLYAASFREGVMLSTVGDAGNFFHDFWMGRELNPRLSIVDLKYICELRPGMFLWFLLNTANAMKQFSMTGSISPEMAVVWLFQTSTFNDVL